jgi:hypothetical protein
VERGGLMPLLGNRATDRIANMHAVCVITEANERRLINMETVAMVTKHEHDPDGHEHPDPVVELHLINGQSLIVFDDGGWGL